MGSSPPDPPDPPDYHEAEQQKQQHQERQHQQEMQMTRTTAFVRELARRTKLDHDQAAREMAPLFGLGKDVLAVQRARCLFLFLKRSEALTLFEKHYVASGWGLATPEWRAVLDLAHEHREDAPWCALAYPDAAVTGAWEVQHHYAKFIVHIIHAVDGPDSKKKMQLVSWLRDRPEAEKFWTLYHTLMYFQLDRERDNMPLRERILRRLSWR